MIFKRIIPCAAGKVGPNKPQVTEGTLPTGKEIVKHLAFFLRVEKANTGKTLLQSKVSSQDMSKKKNKGKKRLFNLNPTFSYIQLLRESIRH